MKRHEFNQFVLTAMAQPSEQWKIGDSEYVDIEAYIETGEIQRCCLLVWVDIHGPVHPAEYLSSEEMDTIIQLNDDSATHQEAKDRVFEYLRGRVEA